MEPGSMADWASSSVAVVALLIAAYAAKKTNDTNQSQSRALQLQQAQFGYLREEKERQQVDRVFTWWNGGMQNLLNLSTAPIFEIGIYFFLEPGNQHKAWELKAPGLPDPLWHETTTQGFAFSVPLEGILHFVILFRDGAGKYWKYDQRLTTWDAGEHRPVAVPATDEERAVWGATPSERQVDDFEMNRLIAEMTQRRQG